MTQLLCSGYFQLDPSGQVIDVIPERAGGLLDSLSHRIVASWQGEEAPHQMYQDLYDDAQVFERFKGWGSQQDYFERLWS